MLNKLPTKQAELRNDVIIKILFFITVRILTYVYGDSQKFYLVFKALCTMRGIELCRASASRDCHLLFLPFYFYF